MAPVDVRPGLRRACPSRSICSMTLWSGTSSGATTGLTDDIQIDFDRRLRHALRDINAGAWLRCRIAHNNVHEPFLPPPPTAGWSTLATAADARRLWQTRRSGRCPTCGGLAILRTGRYDKGCCQDARSGRRSDDNTGSGWLYAEVIGEGAILAANRYRRGAMIPEPPRRLVTGWDSGVLFRRDSEEHPIQIVVDLDTLTGNEALEQLRWMPSIDNRVEFLFMGGRERGWRPEVTRFGPMVVSVDPPDSQAFSAQVWWGPEGSDRRGLAGVSYPEQLLDTASRDASTVDVAVPELYRSLLAARGALEVGDLFATENSYLLGQPDLRRDGVFTLAQSLAVAGLFMRHRHGLFIPDSSGLWFRWGGWFYHWVHARALLPSAWEYVGRCHAASPLGNSELGRLALAVPRRVAQLLRARDDVMSLIWGAHGRDSDELLHQFDIFLVMASAAYDAPARVAHLLAGLQGDRYRASFRSESWRRTLASSMPALATLMAPGTRHRAVLDTVSALRNTIHAEPFGNYMMDFPDVVVGVPCDIEARLLRALSALGGAADFGVEVRSDADWLIRPAVLVERLTACVIGSVDRILLETDLSLLPPSASSYHPPLSDPTFGEPMTQVVRIFGGVD